MANEKPEETAVRIATLLSNAMNLAAILDNASVLETIDLGELRSTLLSIADELTWVGTVAEAVDGLVWAADAEQRIERLRAAATAWELTGAPPAAVLDAARACCALLRSSTPPMAESR
jgi:hypothetical protein